MIKFLVLFFAVVGVIYFYKSSRRQRFVKNISAMSSDELVDAVISRKISILEVPPNQRESVNREIEHIQKNIDIPN